MGVWQAIEIVAALLVAGIAFFALELIYLFAVIRWSDRRTMGTEYCGRLACERERFKRRLRLHAALVSPIVWVLSKISTFRLRDATFRFEGVPAPRGGACDPASFERAVRYEPRPEDVFVVTPMRCGTTWMQHLVFQVLVRGGRELSVEDTTLNAVSPWLESSKTVNVAGAPLVGRELPSRIIKTHLPASLCPYDSRAKFIYVTRHPVSCFASCVDFVRSNVRQFEVSLEELYRWYTSDDLMWWGTWAHHFAGWHTRSKQSSNVLVVRFEDMKRDLESVVRRVAEFLEVTPLSGHELQTVCEHCNFAYMSQHAETFEMHPPHLLQVPGSFFVSGKADRFADVDDEVNDRLLDWCRDEVAKYNLPIERFYPELTASAEVAAGYDS